MSIKSVVAIIGAGNGGQSAAAELARKGFTVHLQDVNPEIIEGISSRGGVTATGLIEGFGPVVKATTSLQEAVAGADIIMPVVPRFAHRAIALELSSVLKESQIVFLNPGSTGGALEFAKILRENGHPDATVSSTATLPYAARVKAPGKVHISLITKTLSFASFPAKNTLQDMKRLQEIYPALEAMSNVLEVSLNNGNPVTHPALTLLNAARIENTQGEFLFYRDGTSPATVRVNEMLDRERLALCQALGFKQIPATERLYRTGYADRIYPSLLEAYQTSQAFAPIKAPKSLDDRYITEDLPYGSAFFASLGDMLGVPMEATKNILALGTLMTCRNLGSEGVTMATLGLDVLSKDELLKFLYTGKSSHVSW